MNRRRVLLATAAGLVVAAAISAGALAQTQDAPADQPANPPEAGAVYKPPLRGAPGGRVGGASRGVNPHAAALPTIELVAPLNHSGETADSAPVLYFFVSQRIALPTQFTISAPLRPAPILEATVASPPAPGLYPLRLADYHVQLDPGVVYTWSVSAIVDPQRWSRNVVASATILRVPLDPGLDSTLRAAAPARRAALLAGAGLWYDAVAAAAEGQNLDRHAALDELLTEVGLVEQASADRATVGGLGR